MARASYSTVARPGFTPLTVKNVSAGRHALILEGESGTLRRTVRVQAGERTVARYEITAGFLSVSSRIPSRSLTATARSARATKATSCSRPGNTR